jgi:hypothetical protein
MNLVRGANAMVTFRCAAVLAATGTRQRHRFLTVAALIRNNVAPP